MLLHLSLVGSSDDQMVNLGGVGERFAHFHRRHFPPGLKQGFPLPASCVENLHTLHYTTVQSTKLRYIILHYFALHYTILH